MANPAASEYERTIISAKFSTLDASVSGSYHSTVHNGFGHEFSQKFEFGFGPRDERQFGGISQRHWEQAEWCLNKLSIVDHRLV